ncbi:hypothetical protein [Pseudaestuariivita atlantica]|uniref:DUF4815 domain-containing protein n=1 Tax=Pseudaestuariivita atlantica TaxID=1317121 RepID=A0A0L1JK15_9RHOB|nr:hypothetical protein [Pseudaestuariivita atlantica]KNG92099.1 hypothetical protein ATO11_19055 [Pseudaestuariivita atlantica]
MADEQGTTVEDITFFNRHIPPLEAGDFVITAWQEVQSTSVAEGGEEIPKTQFPDGQRLTQTFSVTAPRFALDPSEIHAVFPPQGGLGAYDQNLPSVVLSGGALPWERQMNTGSVDDGTPYLAVLLVRAGELAKPLTTYRASEILDPGPGILPPQLTPEVQDKLDEVTAVRVTAGGSGYTSATVAFSGGDGGVGATATADIADGVVTAIAVDAGGSGYTSAPIVSIAGGGAGFAATAVVTDGAVTAIRIASGGTGYPQGAAISMKGGGGTGARASATVTDGMIAGITVTAPGELYKSDPEVTITGDGSGATGVAARGVQGRAIDLSTADFAALMPRYTPGGTSEPRWLAHVRQVSTVAKADTLVTGDGEHSVVVGNRFPLPGPGPVAALTLEATGNGYTSPPAIAFEGGGGSGASAVAILNDTGQVEDVQILAGGTGYTSPPTVTFSGGGGSGAAAVAQTAGTWQAHLVSLEGFTDFLGDTPDWTDPATKEPVDRVRVVSLYNWTFQCLSEFGNFRDLMLNLGAPALGPGGKDALLLRLPDPGPGDGSAQAQQVSAALAQGYTALEYQTRSGVDTFAWYRGPLTPLPVPGFDHDPWQNAGSAMIYDEATGVFDQSYAAGWQAGRLQALSDQNFATELRKWRRGGISLANLLLERINQAPSGILKEKLPSPNLANDDPATVAELETLLESDLFSDAVMEYLTEEFRTSLAPKLGLADAAPLGSAATLAFTAPEPAPPPNVVEALKSLMAQPAVGTLLQQLNGSALASVEPTPLSYVVEWLGRLRLMAGLPFAQMVPDTRALPPESLRFFYVDPNYQSALLDGALSVAIENSQEVLYQSLNYELLDHGTLQESFQTRAKLTGATVANPQATPGVPLVGCLMRSAVVAGWPGLEVKAYATSTNSADNQPVPSNPIQPLRIAHLAPEVLFCLFPEPPAWVEFGEPKEQLAFGIEDTQAVDLRYVSDVEGHQTGTIIAGQSVPIASYFRGGDVARVLDIGKLSAGIEAALTSAYGGTLPNTFDSADFAIQMVRSPEQMIFQNQSAT